MTKKKPPVSPNESVHYFSDVSPATPSEINTLEITASGLNLEMQVADHVFSASRLDPGTKVLLDKAPQPPTSGRFLDLGCGWGVIATTLGLLSPNAEIWAIDVNSRSLDLTQRNAKANGANNVRVHKAHEALRDALEKEIKFDLIWSNPPIRVGKNETHQILMDWLQLLATDGEAWLVVAKNLGADSLTNWLNTQGYHAEKIHSKKGFRIIRVTH